MDVSIIIVNYNTCDLLKQCIQSIITNTREVVYEIIVIDNDSHDESCQMLKNDFPTVKLQAVYLRFFLNFREVSVFPKF